MSALHGIKYVHDNKIHAIANVEWLNSSAGLRPFPQGHELTDFRWSRLCFTESDGVAVKAKAAGSIFKALDLAQR
ncbi:hypothetical protein Y037_3761 [Burkholderia pseudomallei MSHR983]|nr:hypothetical protein BBX_4312 [Burkholderia pseudomallei MSHR520]AIP82802.1 hypothetical protein JE55_3631 [Burkholderia pseudomallei]EBA50176.1 hypothetical protein BURPS305_5914 [Burkholderia pseudomallei 305]KGU60243.1 hypothetical protein Y037_3761 [Burkholderia pseudomallei MSHR983]